MSYQYIIDILEDIYTKNTKFETLNLPVDKTIPCIDGLPGVGKTLAVIDFANQKGLEYILIHSSIFNESSLIKYIQDNPPNGSLIHIQRINEAESGVFELLKHYRQGVLPAKIYQTEDNINIPSNLFIVCENQMFEKNGNKQNNELLYIILHQDEEEVMNYLFEELSDSPRFKDKLTDTDKSIILKVIEVFSAKYKTYNMFRIRISTECSSVGINLSRRNYTDIANWFAYKYIEYKENKNLNIKGELYVILRNIICRRILVLENVPSNIIQEIDKALKEVICGADFDFLLL